ncbi:MAG TPA: anti-sigma factor [Caulobacteraceae bacterium]|nr:anti-sigma factor [Caulobacteraceae bacterium]
MTGPAFDDEILMTYADGELDAESAARLEAAMEADPTLAERVARHRRLRGSVAGAFAGVTDEPVPERLLDAVRGGEARPAEVLDLAAARARKAAPPPSGKPKADWRAWAAIAACLVAAVLVFRGPFPAVGSKGALIEASADALTARGALASALDRQLASAPEAGAAVRVGFSFKASDGAFCRTFQAEQGLAGVACKEKNRWRVRMATTAGAAAPGEYRQAGSETSPAVLAAVDAMIVGEPLDAEAEAAARKRGWKP